jgi:hypothetical protein
MENMEDKNTIKSAVNFVLKGLGENTLFNGRDFLKACRRRLREKGYVGRPYDETLLREFRRQRALNKIYCVDSRKSIYHKGV